MRVLFIVGNGFNFIIEGIIRTVPTGDLTALQVLNRNSVADNIREITALWKKFGDTFQELHDQFLERGVRISDEDLIRLINSVINLFSSLKGFEKILTDADIQRLRSIFDQFLVEKIREIAEEFRQHQKKESYGKIRKYFPNFANQIKSIIDDNRLEKVSIFTTNYDGVLDTLLTKQPNGFYFTDGFINSSSHNELLELVPEYLKRDALTLSHIHGSYRFTKYFGKTYKTKANIVNKEPVMVFNNPSVKEEVVRNDNVLSEYLRHFEACLQTHDRIVILGNSMEAEPHLKGLIRKNFSGRDGTSIVVCARNPERITEQVRPIYRGSIIERATTGISTENDLIGFFTELLHNQPLSQ